MGFSAFIMQKFQPILGDLFALISRIRNQHTILRFFS
jgi:hypothetical protein